MKIEIDTQRDSKEDLTHLADMLKALSGSRRSGAVRPKDIVKRNADVFEDSAPAGGLFNMFGDSASQTAPAADPQPAATAQPAPSQPAQSGTGDLFSIFGSGSGSGSVAQDSGASASGVAASDGGGESGDKTSAQDILDDDSIVPY